MKPRSWEAVRRGPIYCAPACGRGCTFAEYGAALKQAAKLATRLGRGWTGHVRENLGWHPYAISACGRLKVHGTTAFLGSPDSPGGEFAESAATPEEAVQAVLTTARRRITELQQLVEGL